MPDKRKIYTRTGDHGETSLCNGSRTSKDSLRVETYGSIDELNSFLGLCIVKLQHKDIKEHLIGIQHDLLSVGANLAYPADLTQSLIEGSTVAGKIPRITEEKIVQLEKWMDLYDEELPVLKNFIMSGGGTETSALLHVARTVCRRAERQITSLKKTEEVHKNVLKYMNRLSDYLFITARLTSQRDGQGDLKWTPKLNTFFRKKKR